MPWHRRSIVSESYNLHCKELLILNTENTEAFLLLLKMKRILLGNLGPFSRLRLLSFEVAASVWKLFVK